MREPWNFEDPRCREIGSELFFAERSSGLTTVYAEHARTICGKCIHKSDCAEWGINNEGYGIWGGLTQQQMRSIRKQRRIILRDEGDQVA